MNDTHPHLLIFAFDGQDVEFDLSDAEVMINATEMATIFGKKPYEFIRLEQTQRFIAEMKSAFPAFKYGPAPYLKPTPEDENAADTSDGQLELVRTKRGRDDSGATWMHRLLALKFAAWLDARFEVWVYRTVEQVLFAHGQRLGEEMREKARLLDRREELREALQGNPQFQEHQAVEYKLRQIGTRMARHNTSQLQLFRQAQ
jgi:hypothetical protein